MQRGWRAGADFRARRTQEQHKNRAGVFPLGKIVCGQPPAPVEIAA